MKPNRPSIDSIFLAAVEMPNHAARSEYLDRVCSGDAELRRRVERLLAAQSKVGSFLDDPAPELHATRDQPALENAGTQIGPYKLLQQIGEGGFGVVFMAEQQHPVRRTVALKIIKPGMDTRQVIARFESERQALAIMDHPNIAKVLDAGATESGRPYFVMELVKGIPITEFCDKNHMAAEARLKLFIDVCHAIQHAHHKGIIHRDIKPSNVMVTLHDGAPVVKVIDFGVAKATAQRLTERTLFTAFGQMIGTPAYMSPEQAEMSGLDIDTRSDIFSLGVLLYELLTGTTPLDVQQLRKAGYAEMQRMIRDEAAPRPSTRMSSMGDSATVFAGNRGTDVKQLSRLLSGDLDWIVMKALEKDRNRRYGTPGNFAEDLQRYLQNDPVVACPPSSWYRFRKFARRNRVALITALLVSVALVLGIVTSTWQAVRATNAERVAIASRADEARQRQRAEDQQQIADAARKEAEEQRAEAEANLHKAKAAVDEYFTLISESTLLDVPGLQPLRKKLLEAALLFYSSTAEDRINDPTILADLAVTFMRVAEINHIVDRNDDAVAAIDRALAVIDRLRSEFPEASDQLRSVAGFWKGFRPTQGSTEMPRDPDAAFRTLARSIDVWDSLSREYPDEIAFRSDLAALYFHMGDLLVARGQTADGVANFEKAQSILEMLLRTAPRNQLFRADLARIHYLLARNLLKLGLGDDAEAECLTALSLGESLVAEFPQSPHYRSGLGEIVRQYLPYVQQRDPIEAKRLARRGIDLAESLVRDFPTLALYQAELADSKRAWFRSQLATGTSFEEAIADLKEAREANQGEPLLFSVLGDRCARKGMWSDAASSFAKAYELAPGDHGQILFAAVATLEAGDADAYRRVCAQALKQFAESDDPVAVERTAKAGLLAETPGADLQELVRLAEFAVEKEHHMLHYFQLGRGMAAYRTGDWAGTLDWCRRSRERRGDISSMVALDFLFEAMAHIQLDQRDKAQVAMDNASNLVDDYLATATNDRGDQWHDWLMCQIVRREAESLFNKDPMP